jgi:hypothetical protein
MSTRGLALYYAFREDAATSNKRNSRCCADDVVVSERRKTIGMRVHKLASAVGAATSVFVKLLRRPVGGTTVVLVPRERVPEALSTVVFAEDVPRAS